MTSSEIIDKLWNFGLNQGDIAQRLGVAPQTVSRWKTENKCQPKYMIKLNELLESLEAPTAMPTVISSLTNYPTEELVDEMQKRGWKVQLTKN